MPCRLEKVITPELAKLGSNIWLDVCHNEQGLTSVLNQFATDPDKKDKSLTLVCGFSKGKDITKMLGLLSENEQIKEVWPVSCDHMRLLSL